jgi:hypothetical protein
VPCTTQKFSKENNYLLWTLRLDAFLSIDFLSQKRKSSVKSSQIEYLVITHMCFEYVFWNSNFLDKLYAPYLWSGNSYVKEKKKWEFLCERKEVPPYFFFSN